MAGKWAPLESNPEVTLWAARVGLATKRTAFSDVYGLDDELLAMVPNQPVEAVLLVFPLTDEIDKQRKQTDKDVEANGQPSLDPTIYFIKQTISNACGTIALLHSIYNTNVTIKPGTPLQKFQLATIAIWKEQTPEERAKLLETTDLFAAAHAEAASGGQSSLPPNLDTREHFVAFVQAPDPNEDGKHRLIELDGRRNGPLDLGPSEDLLKDAAKVIKELYIGNSGLETFSMITMGPAWE
ncbi:probable ubiquitin thiolesterase L3 [Serendipita indica DSM 11827]|uniref:Ubiquitin carboxyl-terminal hydrolase n=1 Tax=Serendipita indica (strain DSM 11827) TaxID=1109443 RepID=G4T606_SERID|nr:probable ubiquitin thiolesterase L3 [Serendipita indica DSM 11827]